MSNPSPRSLLSRSSLEAVKEQFLALFTRPLRTEFIDFSLDAPQSQLILTARAESDSGEASTYRGSYRWTYVKANLATVLPHPLAVEHVYPMTYRQLRSQLRSRYGLHLEEHELAETNGGVGLVDDSIIDVPLAETYIQLHLYATPQSARFVTGSTLRLLLIQPHRRVPLTALLDHNAPQALNVLAAR